MEGQNGLPLGVNLNDARDMVCECGGKIFMPGVRFKKLSKIMTGQPQDTIIPIEMCYLGWQESLDKLTKLVEPVIADA